MGLITAAILRILGGRPTPAGVAFLFDTDQANANGYASEVGGKALSVWAGAANTSGGFLRSNTTALMRARGGADAAPARVIATFRTPASVAAPCEFYVDVRDNLTNRISAAIDAAFPRIYLYNGYTASELASTALPVLADTEYEVEVRDNGSILNVYVNGALILGPIATASGAGAQFYGVTTSGKIVLIDSIETYA